MKEYKAEEENKKVRAYLELLLKRIYKKNLNEVDLGVLRVFYSIIQKSSIQECKIVASASLKWL